MNRKRPDYNRGKIETIHLRRPIYFNTSLIEIAVIEIDHINYGLNKKTSSLNHKKRTNFTVADIEKFLMQLDGEQVAARNYKGRVSQFEVRIDCPVKGKFFGKEFIMIFDLDFDKQEQIYTITLFPGW